MKLTKMQKITVIAASLFVILTGVIMALSLIFQESPQIREQKKSECCYVSLQKIGVAIQQYLYRGDKQSFPPTLDTLLRLKYLHFPQMINCDGQQYQYTAGLAKDMPSNVPLLIESNAPHVFQYPDNSTIDYGHVLYLDMSLQPLSAGSLKRCSMQSRSALGLISAGKKTIERILTAPGYYSKMEQACALWKWRQQPNLLSPKILDQYLEDFLIDGHIFDCVYEPLKGGKIPRELRRAFSKTGIFLSIIASIKTKRQDKEWTITDANLRRTFNLIRMGDKLSCFTQILNPDPRHKYGNYLDNPRPALRQALYLRQILYGDLRELASSVDGKKRMLWMFYAQELAHPDYATRKNTWQMLFPKHRYFPIEAKFPNLSANQLAAIVKSLKLE